MRTAGRRHSGFGAPAWLYFRRITIAVRLRIRQTRPGCPFAAANVKFDGLNLLDMAEGKVSRPHLIGVGNFHMVHDGRYKYNFVSAGGSELLFDLENDPLEQKNLAREPGEEDTLKRLRRILYTHLEQQGHPAARDGQLISVEEPRCEAEIRAHEAYPAFETPTELLSINPTPLSGA